MQSGHSVKTTPHPTNMTKRADAPGSLDSDDTSDDESSPGGERHHHHRGRGNTTTTNLPAYYSEDGWSTGEHETELRVARQKQQLHISKEKKTIAVVEGKIHVGQGGLGYPDTSIKQQQVRATQKSGSGQTMKSGGSGTKVGEVKVATSKSSDPSKLGSRQAGGTPPVTKGDNTHTSPAGKQSSQQSMVVMQMQALTPAGLLQQQSPIQGLIDGPNSERDGRESPPYLERQIPRDPSSQPQDAWPLFEEDPTTHPHPATAGIPPTMAAAMMLNIAASRQQHQAPPPSSPPNVVLPPASTITTTHNVNPLPPEAGSGILPLLPPLPLAQLAQQQPPSVSTPPQSPSPDQLPTVTGAGQPPPPPLPQNVTPMFHHPLPVSPPSTTATIPPIFQSLMQQQGHFVNVPPMSTAAAMQQIFGVSGAGVPPPHPTSMEMLYNQAHGHSSMIPPPEIASGGGGGGGKPGDSFSVVGMPPLISPLQPLSTSRKSSPPGEHAAMSPLLVTAYTQTTDPKVTHTHVQTEVKETRDKANQFRPYTRKARVQTEGHFVSATELSPPELQDDSKGMGYFLCFVQVRLGS